MRRTVVNNWELSSFHGWGVYGLNLALHWASDPEVTPVSAHSVDMKRLILDPLARLALEPMREASATLVAQLAKHPGGQIQTSGAALLGLNRQLVPGRGAHGAVVKGRANVGVVFLESTKLDSEAVERARGMDRLLAGSSWNRALLRAHGLETVETVLQGVDPALFHPAPRRGFLADRFLVFSGGKLERRKGQDLVLAAFRIFAARHPDALLATAWRSFLPQVARSLDVSALAAPVPFHADGQFDVAGWATASGVPPRQMLDLGLIPNAALPPILREMDVALFPNRCEGGTNLVAMEAMACGVPTILSRNSGHLDLIEHGNCYPLLRQDALTGDEGGLDGLDGWGESDVEEILEALEAAYADRDEARRRGLRGAETLARMTWAQTAQQVKAAILSVL